jgi:hypothetical protein
MNITNITKYPIFKIIGIIAIIYFALFYNKSSPNSLGNRLSYDNIKGDLKQASEKTVFILGNINAAQKIDSEKKDIEPNKDAVLDNSTNKENEQ